MNNFNMFIRQCVLYKRNLFPIWKKRKKTKTNIQKQNKKKQKGIHFCVRCDPQATSSFTTVHQALSDGFLSHQRPPSPLPLW